jgi:hypothetical protein
MDVCRALLKARFADQNKPVVISSQQREITKTRLCGADDASDL